MAYLNREEREKLLNDLTKMSVSKARGKLRRMDPNCKLAYLRNVQGAGEYWTRIDLPGAGVVVTLIERETDEQTFDDRAGSAPVRYKLNFELAEVRVEPTAQNKT